MGGGLKYEKEDLDETVRVYIHVQQFKNVFYFDARDVGNMNME